MSEGPSARVWLSHLGALENMTAEFWGKDLRGWGLVKEAKASFRSRELPVEPDGSSRRLVSS